jgi:hypothetical protein
MGHLVNGTKERIYQTQNVCFDILYNFCLKNFSFQKEFSETLSKLYTGLLVKYPLLLQDFSETGTFFTDFQKILRYQISRKSTSSSQAIQARQADGWTDGQT